LLEWCFTITSKADTSVGGRRRDRHEGGDIIQDVSFIVSRSTALLSHSKSATFGARRVFQGCDERDPVCNINTVFNNDFVPLQVTSF